MAPTIKWQRWDSASYNWFGTTATDALPSVEAELDAWITTVNGNASNVGRQVTKERGYADSTTANYASLVISCGANSNTAKGYMSYGCLGGTTAKKNYVGNAYTDDTSNGGYGTVSGGPSDTSVSWYTSGQEANFLIVTGVVDGEEYFCFGPTIGATPNYSYMDGFFISKATDGEWFMVTGDGASASVRLATHYWDDDYSTGWSTLTRTATGATSILTRGPWETGRYGLIAASSTNPTLISSTARIYAASSDVYAPATTTTQYNTGDRTVFTDLGTGDDVYLLTGYHYGPSFLVDLRA